MKKPLLLILLLIIILISYPGFNIGIETMEEYLIKAGLINRICKYTHWPQSTNPGKPFIISILGKTIHEKEIKVLEQYTINKRKVVVRNINRVSQVEGSHVLFITSSESYHLDAIMEYIGNKAILTVGDTNGFAQRGVIINFYIHMNKVKFEINYEASKKASLQMHSQLFAIGRVVKTRKSLRKDGEK